MAVLKVNKEGGRAPYCVVDFSARDRWFSRSHYLFCECYKGPTFVVDVNLNRLCI